MDISEPSQKSRYIGGITNIPDISRYIGTCNNLRICLKLMECRKRPVRAGGKRWVFGL